MADSETYSEVTENGITVGSNFDSEATIRETLKPAEEAPEPTAETPTEAVGETPAEPEAEPVEAKAEGPDDDEPEPQQDQAPDRLYFRDAEGKFRRASGKEIKHALQRRVDQLTAKLRPTEAELARLRRDLEQAQPRTPAPQPQPPQGKPTLDQFAGEADPYAAWMEALADYKADQKIAQLRSSQAEMEARQAAEAITSEFHERQQAFAAEHPDYNDIVVNSDLPVSPLMTALFSTSERGPELMYYLGSHPQDCLDLALTTMSVPPTEQNLAILDRQMSLRLEAASSTGTPAPSAPARPAIKPIRPVRTGRPADTDRPPGDDAPFSDHVAYWNAKERGDRRRLS